MIGCQEFFSELNEKYLQIHINLVDDGRYRVTRIGIVTLQRDLSSPLRLKDIMFILGLNKNLISIAILEDCCYDVIFKKGKEF